MVDPKTAGTIKKSKIIPPTEGDRQKIDIDKDLEQISRPHFISEDELITRKPKRFLENMIYIVIGIVIIIVVMCIFFTGKKTAGNSDQIQLTVDIGCAVYHSVMESDSWNVEVNSLKLNQVNSRYSKFYQALKPKLQPIMQKYNLTLNDLEDEREKEILLMQADPAFKKEVADSLLKAKCIQN